MMGSCFHCLSPSRTLWFLEMAFGNGFPEQLSEKIGSKIRSCSAEWWVLHSSGTAFALCSNQQFGDHWFKFTNSRSQPGNLGSKNALGLSNVHLDFEYKFILHLCLWRKKCSLSSIWLACSLWIRMKKVWGQPLFKDLCVHYLTALCSVKPLPSWEEDRIYIGRKESPHPGLRKTQTKQRTEICISILSLCWKELWGLFLQQAVNNAWARSRLCGPELNTGSCAVLLSSMDAVTQYAPGRKVYQIQIFLPCLPFPLW